MRILHSWLSKVGRERGEEVTRVSRSVKRTEKHKLLIRWLCLTSKRVRNRDSVRAFQLPDGEGVLAKELTGKTWIFSIVCDEKQKMLNDMTFCFVGLPSQVFHLFCCHSLCSTKISYKREREKEKKKIIPFRKNKLGSLRPFPEPIQFFVLAASVSYGKPPKRGHINQRRDSSKRTESGKVQRGNTIRPFHRF